MLRRLCSYNVLTELTPQVPIVLGTQDHPGRMAQDKETNGLSSVLLYS